MLRFLTQTDADLHAIASNRWASPYERAMLALELYETPLTR